MKKEHLFFQKSLDYIGLFILYLTLISAAIELTILNRPLYIGLLKSMSIPETVGMSLDKILLNYDVLMTYLNNPKISQLKLPDFPVSENGAFHFYEVRELFTLNDFILMGGIILSGIYLYYLYKNKKIFWLVQSMKNLLWLPLAISLMIALFFDRIFVLFHEIAFDNDAWIFSPVTDPIINVLPQEYFMACFISVFLLLELGTFLIYWFAKYYLKRQLNK